MDYYDVEKKAGSLNSPVSTSEKRPEIVDDGGAVPGESFEIGNGYYAKMQRLAGRFKIEQRGIERVPESERTDNGFKALLNVSTMVCHYHDAHREASVAETFTVAISQPGRLLLRHRGPCQTSLLSRLR